MRLVFVICLRVSSKKKTNPKTAVYFPHHSSVSSCSPFQSCSLCVSPSLYHFLTFFLSSGSCPPLCIISYLALFAFDSFFLLLVVFFPSSNTSFRASILPPPPPTVYFWPHHLTDARQVFNCLPSTLNEWVYTTWIRYSYISSRAFFHPPPFFWDW